MPCLTLVAAQPDRAPVSIAALARLTHFLNDCGLTLMCDLAWIDAHTAVDLHLSDWPRPDHCAALRDALDPLRIDFFVHDAVSRVPSLFMADMDATMVVGETMNDLADHAGLGAAVADLTARSMQGEMDFAESFTRRVALLAGQPATLVTAVRAGMVLQTGAVTLVQTLKKKGAMTVLVSGGLEMFTEQAALVCGFDRHHGNRIVIENGCLTGAVIPPILGAQAKETYLTDYRDQLGLAPSAVMAIGDGANDLLMLKAAGLGVGFHAKPVIQNALPNQIRHGDLTALLYLAGWPRSLWAHPH